MDSDNESIRFVKCPLYFGCMALLSSCDTSFSLYIRIAAFFFFGDAALLALLSEPAIGGACDSCGGGTEGGLFDPLTITLGTYLPTGCPVKEVCTGMMGDLPFRAPGAGHRYLIAFGGIEDKGFCTDLGKRRDESLGTTPDTPVELADGLVGEDTVFGECTPGGRFRLSGGPVVFSETV